MLSSGAKIEAAVEDAAGNVASEVSSFSRGLLSTATQLGRGVFDIPVTALQRVDASAAGLADGDDQLDEKYIPVSVSDLIALLVSMVPDEDKEGVVKFARFVAYHVHCLLYERHLHLVKYYKGYDPDRDVRKIFSVEDEQLSEQFKAGLDEQINVLASAANFRKLTQDDWTDVTRKRSKGGLDVEVNFEAFDIEGYVRGFRMQERTLPPYKVFGIHLTKPKKYMVQIFRRLIVRFRLNTPEKFPGSNVKPGLTYIKVFKDFARDDIDMLLPGTKLKMGTKDYLQVYLPLVAGIAAAIWKMATNDDVFDFSNAGNAIGFLVIIASIIGYGVKAHFAWRQKWKAYQAALIRSLYYNQLDTNKGALTLLHSEAERQMQREALLAYVFLQYKREGDRLVSREPIPLPRASLDKEVENWLGETLGLDLNFEVGDALESLLDLGVVREPNAGEYMAMSLDEAEGCLTQRWRGYFGSS